MHTLYPPRLLTNTHTVGGWEIGKGKSLKSLLHEGEGQKNLYMVTRFSPAPSAPHQIMTGPYSYQIMAIPRMLSFTSVQRKTRFLFPKRFVLTASEEHVIGFIFGMIAVGYQNCTLFVKYFLFSVSARTKSHFNQVSMGNKFSSASTAFIYLFLLEQGQFGLLFFSRNMSDYNS